MFMKIKDMDFTAVGDMLIQRRIPKQYQGLDELCAFIQKGDLRYFNLETTINRGELWGNQYSGGSWLRADEKVLEDAKRIGFNMLSFANNHTLDFSHWGLLKTIEALEAHDIPHAGAGRNLAEAAAPAYLDTGKGRFALVSACASFEPSAIVRSIRRGSCSAEKGRKMSKFKIGDKVVGNSSADNMNYNLQCGD